MTSRLDKIEMFRRQLRAAGFRIFATHDDGEMYTHRDGGSADLDYAGPSLVIREGGAR
jgi:hypothetical protein